MEKTCLYCGAPFNTNRESKKYCKDNCKQMSYLKRNGMVRVRASDLKMGSSEPFAKQVAVPHYVLPAILQQKEYSDVNHSNEIKSQLDVNQTVNMERKPDVNTQNGLYVTVGQLESVVERLAGLMEMKLTQAIESIREETKQTYKQPTVKPTPINNAVNQTEKLCGEVPFAGVVKTQTQRYQNPAYCFTSDNKIVRYETIGQEYQNDLENRFAFQNEKIDEEDNEDENDEPEEDQEELTEYPDKIASLAFPEETEEEEEEEQASTYHNAVKLSVVSDEGSLKNTLANPDLKKQLEELVVKAEAEIKKSEEKQTTNAKEVNTTEYSWVESKFINKVEDLRLKDNGGLIFSCPYDRWDIISVRCVYWVNVRFRCLLENLIRLSNVASVNRETLLTLSNAFTELTGSEIYDNLPSDYPYLNTLNYLETKLNAMAEGNYGGETKVKFRPEKKALLLAVRTALQEYTKPIKFSDLDFETPENFLLLPLKKVSVENENVENTSLKKDWEYRAEKAIREAEQKKSA